MQSRGPLAHTSERAARSKDERVHILVAHGQRIYRDGLRRLLDGQDDFLVVGEAADIAETLKLARQLRPDILLLDLAMPRAHRLEMLRELSAVGARVGTILITDRGDEADVVSALQLGARGVITKDCDSEILFRSIRKVAEGEYWISRASVADLVSAIRALLVHAKTETWRKYKITPRQHEIIASVVAGNSNRAIAQQFSLSEETVKRHLTNIFDKIGVSNRLELALFALHHELLDEAS